MNAGKQVVVSGGFDDIRSGQLRFLEEAAKFGHLTVLLWPDEVIERESRAKPKFPLAERLYFLNAVRFVNRVVPLLALENPDVLPDVAGVRPEIWVDTESGGAESRRAFCRARGLEYREILAEQLKGFPELPSQASPPGRKKVVVTGCYDWVHSGHVRFFEEVSGHGDLYVVVGHDENIRGLKGEGHPLLRQDERRYLVSCVRHVKQALISSGDGWLDADPEIQKFKPDIYAVNEDGDKGGKREYCLKNGIEYLVLKRTPAAGLQSRSSTDLRGF